MSRKAAILIVALAVLAAGCSQGAQSPAPSRIEIPSWPDGFPAGFPAAAISGNVPTSVALPDTPPNNPVTLRPYFDRFSWQEFIALNWPAQLGERGAPDRPDDPQVFLDATAGTPVVWGTYKDSFELFGQADNRPTPFNSYDEPVQPCPGSASPAAPGGKNLIFVSKGNAELMETEQAFSFPLIDQRGNYVHYEVRYNQPQYDFVRGKDGDPTSWLYLAENLSAQEPVSMPVSTPSPATLGTLGSIMVKAAWREQTPQDDADRFFRSDAMVFDPVSQRCSPATVLLVGLHIAHKVSPFTEWVWSTFEHVDNVPQADAESPGPPAAGYSFNNGTATPRTDGGYDYRPPVSPSPGATPRPVQVTRVNPIPDTPEGASTVDVNSYYQRLLAGTPWEHYQLIVTQWPSDPSRFLTPEAGGVYPQDAGGAFPVNGAVNTTLETYFQDPNDAAGAGGNSCMSCHYQAAQSDFSWGLNRRAH